MSVSVTYRAEELEQDSFFVLKVQIKSTAEISNALFVHSVTGRYSHVATIQDLMVYPETELEARNLGLNFYRAVEMTYSSDAPQEVRAAKDQIVRRLKTLVIARKASSPPNFGSVLEETIT